LSGRRERAQLFGGVARLIFEGWVPHDPVFVAVRGLDAGADLVRVHDVADVVAYLDVREALRSSTPPAFRGDRADPALKWRP